MFGLYFIYFCFLSSVAIIFHTFVFNSVFFRGFVQDTFVMSVMSGDAFLNLAAHWMAFVSVFAHPPPVYEAGDERTKLPRSRCTRSPDSFQFDCV